MPVFSNKIFNVVPLKTLNAVSATNVFDNTEYGLREGAWGYTTTGGPATASIQLEGSEDGVNWKIIGAALTSVAAGGDRATFATFYPFYRLNLTALTGGTTPTVVPKMWMRT